VTRRKFRTEDPKCLDVTDLAPEFLHPWTNRVKERIVGYCFVFQSFCYVRTNFLKFFVPNIIWCSLFGSQKAQDITTNIIKDITTWARKVQKSLLRKLAGNVGHYQLSVSDTFRHYKRRMKNIMNLKTINREGRILVIFLSWPSGNW